MTFMLWYNGQFLIQGNVLNWKVVLKKAVNSDIDPGSGFLHPRILKGFKYEIGIHAVDTWTFSWCKQFKFVLSELLAQWR